MQLEPNPTSASMSTVRATDLELACLVVKIELRLAGEDAFASLALEVIVVEMFFEDVIVRRIEVTAWLETVPVLGRQTPVLISLWLIAELSMARLAPNMLRSAEQVFVQLCLCSKTE